MGLAVVVDNLGYVLGGTAVTVRLSLVAIGFALLLGAAAGIARLYAPWPIRALSATYIELFRGTPVLVQMFFTFFGLPLVLGLNVSAFHAAVFALALNNGAYFGEIVRGGLQSIPRGQWLAGLALDLT
ncbi:MAG: ABC transporter permease subunit, partial [Candidatus Rokuibacteriota bacterium]